MKMNIKSFFATLLALVTLSACTEPAIDDLTGKYPAPEDLTLSLLSQERVKGEKVHNFNLTLATEGVTLNGDAYAGSGNVLDIKFVGNTYSLGATTYSPKAADAAKNGNYIVGEGGSTYYTVENGVATPVAIESGNITVAKVENDYEIYGTVWLANADKTAVKFEATANIVYEPFPEPTKLSQVLSVTPNPGILTINLGQDSITATSNGMGGFNFEGDGFYLALDIYSADGKLYPGTYKPSAVGGVVGEGEYSIGYDTTVDWGFGPMEMKDWGTCWWTVSGGTTSAQKILEGDITVEKKGSKYTITYGQLGDDIWFEFVGAIEGVDPDAGQGGGEVDTTEYVECTNLFVSQVNTDGTNYYGITIKAATEDVTVTTEGWNTSFSGNGNYLSIDIYTADGKLHTGSYVANTEGGVLAEGQFGIGYDNAAYGDWGLNFGTCWWTVADGATSAVKVLDGEMDVEVDGDNLVIKLRSEVVNAKMIVPVADLTFEVVNNAPAVPEEPEYVECTNLFVSQVNTDGTNYYGITIKAATEDVTVTTEGWNTSFSGNGNYLSIDIYTADGKLHTGSYVANTEGGVLAEGQFGIGYDNAAYGDWGLNFGTCWWTVTDGATSAVKVLDGTMEVEVDGDNLVITLESEVVNAQMIVPVADLTFEVVE